MEGTRKFGAPPKRQLAPGERFQLGIRVTAELKRRLDAAAEVTGRSQSQEAELRLERSFQREDLLAEVLSQTYARPLAGLLLAIGTAMTRSGLLEDWARSPDNASQLDEHWLNDATAFNEAVVAATALLNAARPPGQIEEARTSAGLAIAKAMAIWIQPGGPDNPFASGHLSSIRSLLGPIATRITLGEDPHLAEPSPNRLLPPAPTSPNQSRLVPILTAAQAIEAAGKYRGSPARWGDPNVALVRTACGPRVFALEVFNTKESDVFAPGDLLVLDPDKQPAHCDWVLIKHENRPVLARYFDGLRDKWRSMTPEKKRRISAELARLRAELEASGADRMAIIARHKDLLRQHDAENFLLTNNQSRRHAINDPSSICAVVIECTKSRPMKGPTTFADFRESFIATRSK
jgi:predicted transcriptional regulator